MFKKIMSTLLALLMIFSIVSVASAAAVRTSVYGIYSDGMLFKQNEEAVIAGAATKGTIINAVLYNSANKVVATGTTVADDDNTFAVSFDAPEGSYNEYRIAVSANGIIFKSIKNVVFGELWLASGQSNMQYPLSQDKIGADMYKNNEKLSKWLRVLLVPAVTSYNGSTELVPCEPQKDIPGAKWITGENAEIYETSAVAYFFAASLMEELDMPVGILNASLGGSAIASWISRDAIDGDAAVKEILASEGEYYKADEWVESERSMFYDMTSNYNLKIAPLSNFNLSGMIWYQGESDVILGKTPEQYASMFDLMQRSYTEVFGYSKGLLPIVYTQLVTYPYFKDNGIDLVDMNIGFAGMQSAQANSRAVVSVYDLPLSFLTETGSIHPECKSEIGERMADSAKGLVYGQKGVYTTAAAKTVEIRNGKIYVKFDNVGDGLVCDGSVLRGFAIAGADGVFVQADAEIVKKDTIAIYNENIEFPVSASYAYALGNMRSNLYSSKNGEKYLPVSSFVTMKMKNASYWYEKQWADCDDESVWHIKDDSHTGEYATWESKNSEILFESDSAFSGDNGLRVTASAESFSISPVLTARKGLKTVKFHDEGYDYSDYGVITFNVRNNGNTDITFDFARVYADTVGWYSTVGSDAVIPADGEWHEVEVNLNKLYIYNVDIGAASSNNMLDKIADIEFVFSGEDADISFDNVRFVSENAGSEYNPSVNILNFANSFKLILLFVRSILEYLF